MNSNSNWSQLQSIKILEFSRQFIFTDDLLPQFLKYTGAQKGSTLVDVGCGTGTFTRYLAKGMGPESRVIGIDLDPALIEYANNKAKEGGFGKSLEFRHGNAYELPFDDASIDAVTDYTLLINIGDPDKCIKEELRVLKSGGTISTSTFLIGYTPPTRLKAPPEFDQIVKTQAKINKILKEHVFPNSPIGANDDNIYAIMERYRQHGIKDIQINGLFPLFSPDDGRYSDFRQRWLTDQYELQRWEINRFIGEASRWKPLDLAKEELTLALELLEKRYKYECENTTWIFSNNIQVIISGKK